MKKQALVSILACFLGSGLLGSGLVLAKMPPPPAKSEEVIAKEAAAKAEAAKKDADLLAKYQDRAADNYKKGAGKGAAAASKAAPAPAAKAAK